MNRLPSHGAAIIADRMERLPPPTIETASPGYQQLQSVAGMDGGNEGNTVSLTLSRESNDPLRHFWKQNYQNEKAPLLVKSIQRRSALPGSDFTSKRSRLKRLCTVTSLWIAYLILNVAFSVFAPFFPDEAERKGSSPLITGVITGAAPFCVVILSPVLGYYFSRLGARFMILSGIFLVGGSLILLGFVSTLSAGWMFIVYCVVLRMVQGVGSALFMTSTFTVLPILYPNDIGKITGIFEVGGGIGYSIGPLIGGYFYQVGGFRLPFLITGVLVLLFVVPLMFLITGLEVPENKSSVMGLLFRMWTDVPFVLLMLVNVLAIASLGFFTPVMEPFLENEYKLSPLLVGVVFLVGPLVYMVFSFPLGFVSDALNPRVLVIIGLFIYTLAFFFFGPPEFIDSTPNLWVNCVFYGVIGLACAITIIPAYPDMLTIAERSLGKTDKVTMTAVVSGIVSASVSFGEFIGPLISGALAEIYSLPTSSFLLSLVFAAMTFLVLGVTVIDKMNLKMNRHCSNSAVEKY